MKGLSRSEPEGFLRLLFTAMVCASLLAPVLAFAGRTESPRVPRPKPTDKCPVCGMFISKYPDWTSAVLFKDGFSAFFDGPKCMFRYIFDVGRYDPSRKSANIIGMWAMDYYKVEPIPAKSAWYVMGSDVFGPMGNELVPLSGEPDAREFLRDHKGKRILKFSDITQKVVESLE